MPDYGHDLRFDSFLNPAIGVPERTVEIAHILDELGYDLTGIQDHPYQAKHCNAMELTGYLLGQTKRIRIFWRGQTLRQSGEYHEAMGATGTATRARDRHLARDDWAAPRS